MDEYYKGYSVLAVFSAHLLIVLYKFSSCIVIISKEFTHEWIKSYRT